MSKNTEEIDLLVFTGSLVESPLFLVSDSKENTYYCNEDEWNEELNKVKLDYIDIKSFLDKSMIIILIFTIFLLNSEYSIQSSNR